MLEAQTTDMAARGEMSSFSTGGEEVEACFTDASGGIWPSVERPCSGRDAIGGIWPGRRRRSPRGDVTEAGGGIEPSD